VLFIGLIARASVCVHATRSRHSLVPQEDFLVRPSLTENTSVCKAIAPPIRIAPTQATNANPSVGRIAFVSPSIHPLQRVRSILAASAHPQRMIFADRRLFVCALKRPIRAIVASPAAMITLA
jgi:hypothetical protein